MLSLWDARPQDASSAAELGAAQGLGSLSLRALRLQVGRLVAER